MHTYLKKEHRNLLIKSECLENTEYKDLLVALNSFDKIDDNNIDIFPNLNKFAVLSASAFAKHSLILYYHYHLKISPDEFIELLEMKIISGLKKTISFTRSDIKLMCELELSDDFIKQVCLADET